MVFKIIVIRTSTDSYINLKPCFCIFSMFRKKYKYSNSVKTVMFETITNSLFSASQLKSVLSKIYARETVQPINLINDNIITTVVRFQFVYTFFLVVSLLDLLIHFVTGSSNTNISLRLETFSLEVLVWECEKMKGMENFKLLEEMEK